MAEGWDVVTSQVDRPINNIAISSESLEERSCTT